MISKRYKYYIELKALVELRPQFLYKHCMQMFNSSLLRAHHSNAYLVVPHKVREPDAQAYLPGAGDTLIPKGVPPVRGLSIALRLGWPLRSPQMRETRARNFC